LPDIITLLTHQTNYSQTINAVGTADNGYNGQRGTTAHSTNEIYGDLHRRFVIAFKHHPPAPPTLTLILGLPVDYHDMEVNEPTHPAS
jgi:hypothetical protein